MKWEYQVLLTTSITKAYLNKMGADCWELVTVIPSNGYERELYWKRKVEDNSQTNTEDLY